MEVDGKVGCFCPKFVCDDMTTSQAWKNVREHDLPGMTQRTADEILQTVQGPVVAGCRQGALTALSHYMSHLTLFLQSELSRNKTRAFAWKHYYLSKESANKGVLLQCTVPPRADWGRD